MPDMERPFNLFPALHQNLLRIIVAEFSSGSGGNIDGDQSDIRGSSHMFMIRQELPRTRVAGSERAPTA